MKRIPLMVYVSFVFMTLTAAPRSLQQARQMISDKQALKHVYTANKTDGEPAFFVFNRGNNEGFIIISADDRAHTVLGYSDSGYWDENNLPDNLHTWLGMYAREISYVAMLPERGNGANQEHKRAKKNFTPVTPICQTLWGQSDPYNRLCPQAGDGRCITGCVATAAAQLMKVYNYPTKGIGSHSYKWKTPNGDSIWLSANFGNTTYAWSEMLNSYTDGGTTNQINAVATLMYHCGVACEMNYGLSVSLANNTHMVRSMIDYFGYDKEICPMLKDYMDEDVLIDSIYADLRRNHPVLVSARTISNNGHSFICDGIDQDGLLHINWGWNGKSDGYFRISAFDPKNQGEGGSVSNQAYTERIQFFSHIHPDNNGTYRYAITGDNIYTDKMRYSKEEQVVFRVDTFWNRSLCTYQGAIVAQVYKNGKPYKRHTPNYTYLNLYSDYYYGYATMGTSFNYYPEGVYEVSVCARDEENPDVNIPVMRKWLGEWRCKMTVTGDSIWFEYPEITIPEQRTIPDPTTYNFTRLRAYYYPSSSSETQYRWKLQLSTSDFYTDSGGDDEMLLLFNVSGASPNAITGSFSNVNTLSNYCSSAYQYIGAGSTDYIEMHNAECCLVYDSCSDTYLFHYHVNINGTDYISSATLPVSNIRSYYGEAYGIHRRNDPITLNHTDYTSLSVTESVQMLQSHESNWRTKIPYVVRGTISAINNTPAEMLQYKNCRLYLSDENTSIFAYNTRWLNNTDYQTGNEIQVGGQGTIVGKLYYYQGTTPEIEKGYFCLYSFGEGIDMTQEKATPNVQKILRNGVLYILREGELFTLDGIKAND